MSRSKSKRKKQQKKQKKQTQNKKAKPAPTPASTPAPVREWVDTPEIVTMRRNFQIALQGAVRMCEQDQLEDAKDFLSEAKAFRKAANKIIWDDTAKIKGTALREIIAAIRAEEQRLELEERQNALIEEQLAEHNDQLKIRRTLTMLKRHGRAREKMSKAYDILGLKIREDSNLEDLFFQLRLIVVDKTALTVAKAMESRLVIEQAGNLKERKEFAKRLVTRQRESARKMVEAIKALYPRENYEEVEKLLDGYFRKRPGTDNKDVYVRNVA